MQIAGTINAIGEPITIPTRAGGEFTKREFLLDCSYTDRMSGEMVANFLRFQMNGGRGKQLEHYQVGDRVIVEFSISGRFVASTATSGQAYFIDLYAYSVRDYKPQ